MQSSIQKQPIDIFSKSQYTEIDFSTKHCPPSKIPPQMQPVIGNVISPSNIESIIEALVYPCCGNSMIKILPNSQIEPFKNLYIMPCNHNICEKCIKTIITNKPNRVISCTFFVDEGSNSECIKNYTLLDAERQFVQNLLVNSFVSKLVALYLSNESVIKAENQTCRYQNPLTNSIHKNVQSHSLKLSNQMSFKKPNLPMQKDIQIDDQLKKNLFQQEQQQKIFTECQNLFCRKQTGQCFCSQKCFDLQNQLDELRLQIPRPLNVQDQTTI